MMVVGVCKGGKGCVGGAGEVLLRVGCEAMAGIAR